MVVGEANAVSPTSIIYGGQFFSSSSLHVICFTFLTINVDLI